MVMLRVLVLVTMLGLLGLLLFPAVLAFSGLQAHPLVQPTPSPQQEDVARIKTMVKAHDPRRLQDGEVRTLEISAQDINIGLRSLLPMSERQFARVTLDERLGTLDYTLRVPNNPLGSYLNASLSIAEEDSRPALNGLQVGTLALPGWSLRPLVIILDRFMQVRFSEYDDLHGALQSIAIKRGNASITYRWDQELARQLEQRGREVFVSTEDRERMLAYYRVLAEKSRQVPLDTSLSELMQALFSAAEGRSTATTAAAENRALLLVLGTVMNRSSMHRLVGGDPDDLLPRHRFIRWSLHGRVDLAQHFAISAAIAAAGGDVLADAIGAMKELDDSRGGTGFSFPDLLADRAGVELSNAALGDDAQSIQNKMAAGALTEDHFMPPLDNLPEGLMEMEFKQRYSDLDNARYRGVKSQIDNRIMVLPIHAG